MKKQTKKTTPSQCRFANCHWNFFAPGENSQECIACEGLKKEKRVNYA